MKKTLISILIGVLLIGVLILSAGERHKRWFRGDEFGIWKKIEMVKDLNLTEEQKKQIGDLRLANQKTMIDLRAKVQAARLDLGKLLEDPKADPKKVEAIVNEINKVRSEMFKNMVDFRIKINKILTSEQLEKIKGLRFERGMGFCGKRKFFRHGMKKY
ncbi:MAG: Spy/CpxP family protein refolding chaperone [Acidobacteriota bacterium]